MRTAVRIASIVVAAALVAAATLGIVEIVLAAIGRDPLVVDAATWDERLRSTTWDDGDNQLLAGLVALGGLVLLGLAWWPRRPAVVGVGRDLPHVDARAGTGGGAHVGAPLAATVRRRPLEQALARAATGVDTITDARVHVGGDAIEVEATTARRQAGDLGERVRGAVDAAARRLAVDGRPTRVRVRSAGGRS